MNTELPEPERQRAQEALKVMDQTGQVKPAYDQWRAGGEAAPLAEPEGTAEPEASPAASTKARPAVRNRKPLPAAFRDASYDLVKIAERLQRLIEDDRFTQNAEQVARLCRGDLLKASDLLAAVVGRVPNLAKETIG